MPTKPSDTTKDSTSQKLFLKKVGDDEPIFILRARDSLSRETITEWLRLAKTYGVREEKIQEVVERKQVFEDWQEEHGTRVPD